MKKLDPNQIPSTIQLVVKLYIEKRDPTKEEHAAIDNFFKTFMGKAIVDCQNASKALWSPSKPMSELNFSSKEVIIDPKDETGGVVKFVVATTRSLAFNAADEKRFKDLSIEKVVKEYSAANTDFNTVFSKLISGKDIDVKSNFINTLFFGIFFSKDFFVEDYNK